MSWTKIETEGDAPAPRHEHAAALADSNHLFVFGGQSKTEGFGDLWELDLSTRQWQRLYSSQATNSTTGAEGPAPRWGATLSAVGGKLFLYGGEEVNGTLGEVWVWEGGAWSEAPQTGQTPTPRSRHSANVCYDTFIIVVGGLGPGGDETSDVAVYDTSSGEWHRPFLGVAASLQPPPRKRHSAAVIGTDLVVFAGWQGNRNNTGSYWADMWILDMENYEWKEKEQKGAIPQARAGHGVGVVGDHLFLWGGWGSGSRTFNELHYFELGAGAWRKQKRGVFPSNRYNHSVCVRDKELVVFGGAHNADECTNETWLLDVSSIY